mmetsp:Transcript_26749/g.67254  ORF Transcript_26749/g.67254 Transcript_26749/m.67254 type:complete len:1113 (+) Transcript_26749:2-3340(+)
MKKNGYVQLSQYGEAAEPPFLPGSTGAAGSPGGTVGGSSGSSARPLVRHAAEGSSSPPIDQLYVDNACCAPVGKATKTNWIWVGEGRGTYMQTDQYTFVGEGAGDYDPHFRTVYKHTCASCMRSWCCPCVVLLVVLLLAAYGAATLAPRSGSSLLSFGRPNSLYQTSTTRIRPSRYTCAMPLVGGTLSPQPSGRDDDDPDAAWSEAKRVWCCTNAGIGCTTVTTSGEPYDCAAGLKNWRKGWSMEKQDWCCEHIGVGCVATTSTSTTSTASLPYDCDAEFHNWKGSWSLEKQKWCCHHSDRGCLPTTTSLAYDCLAGYANWQNGWSIGKKQWCCHHAGRGCPPMRPSVPFDCDAGYDRWSIAWSKGKKDYCCQHAGRGCESAEVPLVCKVANAHWEPEGQRSNTHKWCCREYGRFCDEPSPYDCHSEWPNQWSAGKTAWCCLHHKLGCPSTTTHLFYSCKPSESEPLDLWNEHRRSWCCFHQGVACPRVPGPQPDCSVGPHNSQETWDFEKRSWCCKHYERGCVTTTTLAPTTTQLYDCTGDRQHWTAGQTTWCCAFLGEHEDCAQTTSTTGVKYDCKAGYSNWEKGWSHGKKTWCCEHTGRACTTTTTSEKFDCEAGYSNWKKGWSESKKGWCCIHYYRGCPTVTHKVTTTGLPFDCKAGYANWEKGWSINKQSWCCDHVGRGCPTTSTSEPFDCNVGLANWELAWPLEKQVWCCTQKNKGCSTTTTLGALPYDCRAGYENRERGWSIAKKIWCCRNGGFDCEKMAMATTTRPMQELNIATLAQQPTQQPVVSCKMNCFGDGAQAVRLEGSLGTGDGAAIRGLSIESCRQTCRATPGCDGILYTNGTRAAPVLSLCYGKKEFHISKCQPAEPGVYSEVLNTMPWGQCAIVGDPHVITWDRVFGDALIQTDPGDYWLVKSTPLNIMGRFGFTDRFPNASSATGVAVTGSMIKGHRLIVEYVGPVQGHVGFKATWDGADILTSFPSSYVSSDGVLDARLDYMNPMDFHREGRHTIGGTEGDLPSYLFKMTPDLEIYVLTGPDNCNIVITTKKVSSGQDGYCGNFNCDTDDDLLEAVRARGLADPVPMGTSIFTEPPRAPRAIGASLHGGPAQD